MESLPNSASDSDFEQTSRKRRKPYVPVTGPSRLHMQAQHSITTKSGAVVQSLSGNAGESSKAKPAAKPNPTNPNSSDASTMTGNNNSVNAVDSEVNNPIWSKQLIGKLSVTKHELKKYKRMRRFSCKLCETVTGSRKEINEHHKVSHDKCYCKICGKACNIPSTLEQHLYSHHENLPFPCADCDDRFAFASQLKQHRFKHTRWLLSHA